jgi:methylenetetrahydrofolate dehydrogenase (NADP+)/methenyltetrahydrofolate cyclohydrolase
MIILDGRKVSESRREALKAKTAALKLKYGSEPHLVVVLVGADPASQVYVRNKIKACESVGIRSTKIELPDSLNQAALNATIEKLALDPGIDGILVQLPLPKGLKESEFLDKLSPEKDVDCFTYSSLGRVWSGHPLVSPCTPKGVMSILEHYQISLEGLNAVVVGRSQIVGKPMAHLLTEANATVTLCHSKTKDLQKWTRQADLVVVAAGKKEFLGKDDFKKDAIVIDVGMHGSGLGQKLCGDVNPAGLENWVKAFTPVPGGVGPMTITTLLENTVILAEYRRSKI